MVELAKIKVKECLASALKQNEKSKNPTKQEAQKIEIEQAVQDAIHALRKLLEDAKKDAEEKVKAALHEM